MGVLDRFALDGQVAVVTGATRGLGRGFATALGEAGAFVLTATLERFDKVDVLVNDAGTCVHAPALDVTPEDWRSVMATDVDALWTCSQVFGRHFVEAGGGTIVNIGSISAMIVNRPQWQPAYNASKAAVHQLTKSLAAE